MQTTHKEKMKISKLIFRFQTAAMSAAKHDSGAASCPAGFVAIRLQYARPNKKQIKNC
jgi:hypothetical protein